MAKKAYCSQCKSDQEVVPAPLRVLEETERRLPYLVRGLSPEVLLQRPKAQEWSIAEVLWHLADAEIARSFRMRVMLAQNTPELPAWDQELWAKRLNYEERPPKEALALFRALRRANTALLKGIPASAWQRSGHHSVAGRITVASLTQHTVHHDQAHLAQIAAIRAAVAPKG